ncbi:MAG: hypothetical protein AB7Q81_24540 [Gammaproteobacteria bacterium]
MNTTHDLDSGWRERLAALPRSRREALREALEARLRAERTAAAQMAGQGDAFPVDARAV